MPVSSMLTEQPVPVSLITLTVRIPIIISQPSPSASDALLSLVNFSINQPVAPQFKRPASIAICIHNHRNN